VLKDVRLHYVKSMEESLVDASTLLASILSSQIPSKDTINTVILNNAFDIALERKFNAMIYNFNKTSMNIRVYVTNKSGIVVFDSEQGRDKGKDYSKWNDVRLTLVGKYGARSTRAVLEDPSTSHLYVASPIIFGDSIAGVLTVSKPSGSINLFVDSAKNKIMMAALISAIWIIGIAFVFSMWVTFPIKKLTKYALAVKNGDKIQLPRLGRNEIGEMGKAFEEMKNALEGKSYVEQYIQTLTHEIKSPLSAIKGAAELLEENMPEEQRLRFIKNINNESSRIQNIIDRLLKLSSLENRQSLKEIELINVKVLLDEIVESLHTAYRSKKLTINIQCDNGIVINGEKFLVRQAITNLLQNASDFSFENGIIDIVVVNEVSMCMISIIDRGAGIPQYARNRIFERFYSLPRPVTNQKSSGLGLSFVKEVATLHGGKVVIDNCDGGGVRADLHLPI
jgi:two-component system sensor histidine kinase CreC